MLATTGRAVLSWVHVGNELVELTGAVILRGWRLESRELARHALEVGNRSVLFITVVMAFVGAIMVIQASAQAQRIIGDLTTIGPGFLRLVIREFGPTIICLMVAARAGAGMAAEIGAMTITEQLDALRLNGAEPVRYIVAPRVWGGVLGVLPLVVWGSFVAYLAGGIAATSGFGVAWETYLGLQSIEAGDVVIGLVKAGVFGFAVPLVACNAGLRARGGAPGVGSATTAAVIVGSLVVLLFDLLIGTIGHLLSRASG